MQLSKTLLIVSFAASSVSAAVILPRQSSDNSGPNVPTCTNPDPSCDVYSGLMVCVPTCYQISGGSNSGISINTNQPTTNCDINTLKCDDGKQLTGCYIQGSQATQSNDDLTGNKACGTPQGDGRNTGAAVPGSAAASSAIASQTAPSSSASAEASSTEAASSVSTSAASMSAASTSVAANTAAAASASPSTKSNGAADLRPHAVGALLAIGALASTLF